MLTSTGRTLFYRCWLLDQLVTLAWKHLFGQSNLFWIIEAQPSFHQVCVCNVHANVILSGTKLWLVLTCLLLCTISLQHDSNKSWSLSALHCECWALFLDHLFFLPCECLSTFFLICLLGISCSKWRGVDGAREEKQLDLSAEQLACHVTN